MFPAAVFYESEMHSDCLYRVNDVHAYSCRNGRWSGLRNYRTADRNSELGSMLATIDRLMRLSLDYGHPIKEYELPKYLLKIVNANISAWLASRHKAESRLVSIDRSQLAGIRSRSAVTRDQLLIEEERFDSDRLDKGELFLSRREDRSLGQSESVKENDFEDTIITEAFSADVVPVIRQNPALRVVADETVSSCNLPYGLSSTELSFLRVLIDADKRVECSSPVESEDIIVDSINEKLFELLGDIAIEYADNGPVVIEDYRDDLKGALGL